MLVQYFPYGKVYFFNAKSAKSVKVLLKLRKITLYKLDMPWQQLWIPFTPDTSMTWNIKIVIFPHFLSACILRDRGRIQVLMTDMTARCHTANMENLKNFDFLIIFGKVWGPVSHEKGSYLGSDDKNGFIRCHRANLDNLKFFDFFNLFDLGLTF